MNPRTKYPHVTVRLIGTDGNVFALVGRVRSGLRRGGVPPEEVEAFVKECFSQESYDHVLTLIMRTVDVE